MMDLKLLLLLPLPLPFLLGSAPPRLENTRPPFSRRVLGVIGARRDEDVDEDDAKVRGYLPSLLLLLEVERDEGFSIEDEDGVLRPT